MASHAPLASRSVRRTALAVLMAAAFVVSPVAVSAGGNRLTANIEQGNGGCGADDPNLPVMGKVTFARNNKGVSVTFDFKGDPDTIYNASIWSASCSLALQLGTITTDARGNARYTFKFFVWPDTTGFATIFANGTYNDAPTVTFP